MRGDRQKRRTSPPRAASDLRWFVVHYERVFHGIVAVAGLLYACLTPRYKIGFLNDDAIYVITAKDFWKTALSHPLLGVKPDYPLPGVPLFLKAFVHLVSPHWNALEWLSVIATVTSVYLLGRWARRYLSPGETLVAMSLFAFNRVVAQFSGIIMAGPYFTVAAIASFVLVDKILERPSFGNKILLGLIAGWGSVCRPEACLLAFSVVLVLTMSPLGRRAIPVVALPILAWSLFIWFWFQTRQTLNTEFGGDLAALGMYWREHARDIIPTSFAIVQNFFFESLPSPGPNHGGALTLASRIATVVTGSVMAIGFVELRRKASSTRSSLLCATVFCVTYFMAHVFWKVAEPRYLLPLMPFACILFVRGARRLLPGQHYRLSLAFLFLLLPYAYQTTRSLQHAFFEDKPANAPPWNALSWIRDNTDPAARVTSNVAPSVDLYTGRAAMGVITVDNGDEFLYLLLRQRIDYVVFRDVRSLTPGVAEAGDPNFVFDLYRRWLAYYPGRLIQVFEDASEKTRICRVNAPAGFREAFDIYVKAAERANAGDYGAARDLLTSCLATCPELGSAVNLMGALLALEGRNEEAEKAFVRASALRPDSAGVLLNLANIAHLQKRFDDREAYLKRAAVAGQIPGNQIEFTQNLANLQHLWSIGRSTFFFKAPHANLYDQISGT